MRLIVAVFFTLLLPTSIAGPGRAAETRTWPAIEAAASGQRVHFNAWGGDGRINAYIEWVGARVAKRWGIELVHVKLADTADAVARILAEKTAGRVEGGSVDLIWVNGENFAAMKRHDLLHGPWVGKAPNFALVDVVGKPTTILDFTIPTDGLEAPWGMAQFVMMYDSAYVQTPPRTLNALADWIIANPGRFTYPQPPDFLGATFLKQVLVSSMADATVLQRPVDEANALAITEPLWGWLDRVHGALWRSGRVFPPNGPALKRRLADSEVSFALAFNPAEASVAIATGELPDTVRTFTFEGGTLANTHFVAVPFNAAAREGAMVVANYLMSAEAQARKQDPRVWGDFTVLNVSTLPVADRARFDTLPRGVATLSPQELGPALPEPHPSWSNWLEREWIRRYAVGK